MKQNATIQSGFTLIELLVVISIMMLSFAIVLVGLNQQRIARSTGIAQNETITNVRKVQSYMLSSRNIGDKPAKYYLMRFSTAQTDNSSYTVQAIDSDYTPYSNIETVNLTNGVVVSGMSLIDGAISTPITSGCALVSFSAPFGKIYVDTSNCDAASFVPIAKDPVELIKRADKTLEITFTNPRGNIYKKVLIYGFSGRVLGQ